MEENKEIASIQLTVYQQRLSKGYNKKVRPRNFITGDLVLRRVLGGMKELRFGKLATNWEGLYCMTAIAGTGAYYLEAMKERPLPQPWNVSNLKKYFQLKKN